MPGIGQGKLPCRRGPFTHEGPDPCLPVQRGNVRISNIAFISALRHVPENCCRWRALPRHFGNWFTRNIPASLFRTVERAVEHTSKGGTLASRFTSSSSISTMPSNADAAVKTVTPHKSKRKTAISVEPQNLCQSGYHPIDCSPRRADSPVFQVAPRWFSLNGGIMQLGSSFKNCATVATEQMHMFKIEP